MSNKDERMADRISSLEDIIRSLAESKHIMQAQLLMFINDHAKSASSPSATSPSSNLPMEAASESPEWSASATSESVNTETRSVPQKNWATTSASVSAMFMNNRIHDNTKDSFRKISMVRGGLSTAGLKNLLDSHR